MAFGAVKPGMPQRQDEKKPPPVWSGDDFFTRSDGGDYPPRRMKETVSGRCDAINWMTLLFAQFIDQTFEVGRQRRGFER
ncbi:hypothetical protein M2189_005503 [Bradyrhizobium japonicum]|jgi:hypothetical protein|uniref:hypothetical protein n=1 Tax=Bradyrhizobium japonicum TaxID=375 RepID=UPI00347D2DF2|nr:hypothetical protein [Bradyrhizobium japonicum]MCS3500755.1 hypothetical protein [Bradyrhizobium japonicum]MCS3957090.1 hypothetical protein [Bradyrhizobium japonicum]MCS3962300.1 hypothetical protein [Bradyrhizobium japonicum]MCS3994617.1 hypothetical protein [Bradyrhizobium japonicum]